MQTRVFLDTNIMLDLLNTERKNHIKAKSLTDTLIQRDATLLFSEDEISTIFYLSKKSSLINQAITSLKNIETSSYFKIVNFGMECRIKAYNHFFKQGGDLEDLLQYYTALRENCSMIVSEDKGFPRILLSIVNYSDLGL